MPVQNMKSADHPRRRLSLRFSESSVPPHRHTASPLSTKELQRIVADMVG